MVVSNLDNEGHTLKFDDVCFEKDNSALKVLLRSSKTDQLGKGVVLLIPKTGTETCPVKCMLQYVNVRKTQLCKHLFCHFNSLPLTRYQFSTVLKKSLGALGLQKSHYRSHSFRIGAATTASQNGMADDKIKSFGRWKSDAFKSYIRIPTDALALK